MFKEGSNCTAYTYSNSYSGLKKKSKIIHSSSSQALISQPRSNSMTCKDNFNNDLCEALIASNIPLKKLNNPKFRSFLKKYCMIQKIPDESTLRKNYIVNVYRDI